MDSDISEAEPTECADELDVRYERRGPGGSQGLGPLNTQRMELILTEIIEDRIQLADTFKFDMSNN